MQCLTILLAEIFYKNVSKALFRLSDVQLKYAFLIIFQSIRQLHIFISFAVNSILLYRDKRRTSHKQGRPETVLRHRQASMVTPALHVTLKLALEAAVIFLEDHYSYCFEQAIQD